jgi:hypothetical protein
MTTAQPQHNFDHFTVLQNLPPQQHFAQHGMPMATDQHFQQQIQNQNALYHSHSIQNFNPQQAGVDHYALSASQQSSMPPAQHTRTDMEDSKKRNSTGGGAAAATQSNEKELREALDRNVHRTLKDVAKEVIDTERTSRAEKSKQLFAMLWYVFAMLTRGLRDKTNNMTQALWLVRDSKDIGAPQQSICQLRR